MEGRFYAFFFDSVFVSDVLHVPLSDFQMGTFYPILVPSRVNPITHSITRKLDESRKNYSHTTFTSDDILLWGMKTPLAYYFAPLLLTYGTRK